MAFSRWRGLSGDETHVIPPALVQGPGMLQSSPLELHREDDNEKASPLPPGEVVVMDATAASGQLCSLKEKVFFQNCWSSTI